MSRVRSRAAKIAMAMFMFCFPVGSYANSTGSNNKYLDVEMQNTPTDNLRSDNWNNGNGFNSDKNSIAVNRNGFQKVVFAKAKHENTREAQGRAIFFAKAKEPPHFVEIKVESTANYNLAQAAFTNTSIYNKDKPDIDDIAVKLGEDKATNCGTKEREEGIQETMFSSYEKQEKNKFDGVKREGKALAESKNKRLKNFVADKEAINSKSVAEEDKLYS